MTNDVSKVRTSSATSNSAKKTSAAPVSHARRIDDDSANGYTRVKSGDLKRRSVSRSPDMSNPVSKSASPDIAIGGVPTKTAAKNKAIPVASVRVEPTVRTVTDTTKVTFPYSVVFLAIICSLLFFYMIFNYVQINEHTSALSDLKADIATLSFEAEELTTKLDQKNDLNLIEQLATEKLGMVKIDEVTKKYVTMDSGDYITPFDSKGNNTASSTSN